MTWTVSEHEGRVVYTVGATPQSQFTVPFPVDRKEDLKVWIDNVEQPASSWTWTPDPPTSIAIAPSGKVTLSQAVSNKTVAIERQMRFEQRWSIVSTSSYRAVHHSREIARLWMAMQDLARRAGRVFRLGLHRSPFDELSGTNRILILDNQSNPKAATPSEVKPILESEFLPRTGGSMSGQITMSVAPTQPTHVATKSYVDTKVAEGGGGGGGGGGGPYLPLAGGTMTGQLDIDYAQATLRLRDGGTTGSRTRTRFRQTGQSAGSGLIDGFLEIECDEDDPSASLRAFRMRVRATSGAANGAGYQVLAADGTLVHDLASTNATGLALPSSARIGIGTNNPQAKLHVADTGCMIVPSGTTAQQPSPVVGGLRFDTTTGKLRFCDGSQWRDVGEGAGGGVVQTVTEQALREIVQVPHNTQLNAGHAFDRLRLQSGDLRLYGRIVEVTGSADATVTLPNATEPIAVGSLFVIRHALSAGQVTIAVPSGSSINGGSSVTIPWSGGVAVCTVESIGANNAVTYRARGDLSTPLDLPGVTVKGAATFESTVRGGRVSVGSNITGNVTLGADDVGRLRIVTASGVTVTVPNDWRGCAELHFTQAGTVNIGGQNKSVPANSRAVVEVVEVGGTPYRWLFVGGVA